MNRDPTVTSTLAPPARSLRDHPPRCPHARSPGQRQRRINPRLPSLSRTNLLWPSPASTPPTSSPTQYEGSKPPARRDDAARSAPSPGNSTSTAASSKPGSPTPAPTPRTCSPRSYKARRRSAGPTTPTAASPTSTAPPTRTPSPPPTPTPPPTAHRQAGHHQRAYHLLRELADHLAATTGPDAHPTLAVRATTALVLHDLGHHHAAHTLLADTIDRHHRAHPRHPATARMTAHLNQLRQRHSTHHDNSSPGPAVNLPVVQA